MTRRLARRGGVVRIQKEIYDSIRDVLRAELQKVGVFTPDVLGIGHLTCLYRSLGRLLLSSGALMKTMSELTPDSAFVNVAEKFGCRF